jgi:hypothetical protein
MNIPPSTFSSSFYLHNQEKDAPYTMNNQSSPCSPTGQRGESRHRDESFSRTASFRSTLRKPEAPKPHRRRLSLASLDLQRSTSVDSEDTTRSVNLFDLIDEEFVVNCGVFGGTTPRSSVPHKRRRSILDMIDRVFEDQHEDCSSFMTERSYPRGVYIVPPTDTQVTNGNVGFVAADALQWRDYW